MAYEIHDGPVQQMAACLMSLQALERVEGTSTEQGRQLLHTTKKLLEDGIAEARMLINHMNPPLLDELGIVLAIEHLVCQFQNVHGPAIEFSHEVEFVRLGPALEHALFRIAQESVRNACRHSQSSRIQINLVQHRRRVRLDIRDWGVGFDIDAVEANHFGLQGIRDRARVLGGTASIHSTAGRGTCIAVELPLVEAFPNQNDGLTKCPCKELSYEAIDS